jgi:16S rRNA (cytidine1402-2'-O)-methyltransferase
MKIHLTLVPTPIANEIPLEPVAQSLLLKECLQEDVGILVEEHKVARIRWLAWGLPREAIEKFILFNEHTQDELVPKLIREMKSGKRFYLMSDAGLPAFCDPGQKLVNAVHEAKLNLTATPFANSVSLALAMSGFPHHEFFFAGFLPANAEERKSKIEQLARAQKGTLILMDTPYRMQALVKDLKESTFGTRTAFVATQLNKPDERLFRGKFAELARELSTVTKVEFILVISPH